MRTTSLLTTLAALSGAAASCATPRAAGTAPPAAVAAPSPGPATATDTAASGDCPAERLEVHAETLDLGQPYQPRHWRALPHFVNRHSHLRGDELVLLVPEVNAREQVTALEVRRLDLATHQWRRGPRQALEHQEALAPRFTEVESALQGDALHVRWSPYAGPARARVFSLATGAWREGDGGAAVPARDGLATHPGTPPNPDPTTGVRLAVSGEARTATRLGPGGRPLGTVTFPARPGSYVGAFAATRAALLQAAPGGPEEAQLPPAERFESYLVNLDTGAACRVPRALPVAATVFRTPDALVFLRELRTEAERVDCPPGAPCVAPRQPHFRGVSLAILRDRGPTP